MEISPHEQLPTLIPPQEAHQDWQPKTEFWQILTGHQKVFGQGDVNEIFFPNNQLTLPQSELVFFNRETDDKGYRVYRKLQNPILVQPGKEGFSPQEVLHQSWLGVQDSLRMYVFDEEGLEALQQQLKSLGIHSEPLKTGLGIMVETKIPAIVKDEQNGEIKKEEVEGVVFFLKEDALQKPADALALVAEIAKLHPETTKDLMSSLLIKARVVSHNIQVWRDVLKAYETDQLPSELDLPSLSQLPKALQDIFSQIKSYLEKIPDDLIEFEKGLTEKFKEFKATPLAEINDLPLPFIDENEVIKHLKRILKIALNEPDFFQILPKPVKKLARKFTKKILEQKNPERLKRLLRRLETNIIKTPDVVNEAYDPKKLLLTEVAERGQQLMLDRMEPSDGMISKIIRILDEELFNNETIKSWNNLIVEKSKEIFSQILFYGYILDPEAIDEIQQQIDKLKPHVIELWNQKHPDKPLPKNVREWIEAMGIKEEFIKLKKELSKAEDISLNEEQQEEYQKAYQEIEEKINDIIKNKTADEQQKNIEWDQFPPHPILARWGEIWGEIEKRMDDNKFEEPVKDKIRAVFEAKRKLAEKQEYYTNLFLETTIKYMPGGYDGWNEELKGVLRPLLEASPYFAPLFKEPNCVGRMILLSGMLMEAQVFEEEYLVEMSTYKHAFLGGFDALGVGKVIEGSDCPKYSYFGIPKEKVFKGKVLDNPAIIFKIPLQIGLLTEAGINYSILLEKQKARKLKLYLLQQSGYIRDILWYNLSADLYNLLDCFFARSRAASINNFFPKPFYYLLYNDEIFNKTFKALEQEKSSPLLPYIKLNLLVMQRALEDEENAEELRIRINNDELKGKLEFTKDDVETMKENLQTLLYNIANIETPSYWQKKYGPNLNATIEQMRKDLWNPNLFPKPVAIDDEGNVIWEIPSS
jgi:hypothetical protein